MKSQEHRKWLDRSGGNGVHTLVGEFQQGVGDNWSVSVTMVVSTTFPWQYVETGVGREQTRPLTDWHIENIVWTLVG